MKQAEDLVIGATPDMKYEINEDDLASDEEIDSRDWWDVEKPSENDLLLEDIRKALELVNEPKDKIDQIIQDLKDGKEVEFFPKNSDNKSIQNHAIDADKEEFIKRGKQQISQAM